MTPSNGNTPATRSTLDQQFKALSHPTRRRILLTLDEHNPRDEEEFESTAFRTADQELAPLTQPLYHKHLPHLADAGFIEWDRDTNTITRGPRFEDIEPLLELIRTHQDELPDDWP